MEEIKNNKPPSTSSMSSPKGMDKVQKILNKKQSGQDDNDEKEEVVNVQNEKTNNEIKIPPPPPSDPPPTKKKKTSRLSMWKKKKRDSPQRRSTKKISSKIYPETFVVKGSFTIVNTDFEMQQTKIFHRESHAPFLLRMHLFDMIGKMRIARLKQRRRRIDHSGVIHELDMSRKGSFVLQEISNKFVNAQNLITNVLGQKKSKHAYRGALYVYTDVGPKWLNKIVKKIKEFGKTVDKKTDEVSMKRKQLQYMELLNISRGNSPSNSPNTHSSKSSTNNKKMAQM